MSLGALGRIPPPDFEHVSKYPIRALASEQRPIRVPVVMGTSWFPAMDNPTAKDGIWWISDTEGWDKSRGGHAYCLEPAPEPTIEGEEIDSTHFWTFHNQRQFPSCEGVAHARMMALLHKRTFDGFWLYSDALRIEGRYPKGEGTTNRATMAALSKWGAHYEDGMVMRRQQWRGNDPTHTVRVYRWASSVSDILEALGTPNAQWVTILNSWGRRYPHRVRLSCERLSRLLHEDGECGWTTEQ